MARRMKVAVADDERDTREYLQEFLTHLGHEVRTAADGRALVDLCRAFGPDLVITDHAMPHLDGLAAAAAIHRERPVPVILLSGRPDIDPQTSAARDAVVRFLAKPVRLPELRAAVEAVASGVACPVGD